jgi:MYXO-CTERM domain-containing protein
MRSLLARLLFVATAVAVWSPAHALDLLCVDDRDGDGYTVTSTIIVLFGTCESNGHLDVSQASNVPDCDDSDDHVHPGHIEDCDGLDNDCNTLIDDNPPNGTLYGQDGDADGFGSETVTVRSCGNAPFGFVDGADDCNDADPEVHPGAPEVCNNVDDDCDGGVDDVDGGQRSWLDADGDGWGDPNTELQGTCPAGYVANPLDCDDTAASIHPGASEVCNLVDDNCDGQIDEGSQTALYYRDADSDGFGNARQSRVACMTPPGFVSNLEDCDDTNAASYPGGTEVCDGSDNDCDGAVDDGVGSSWYVDGDADGFGAANGNTIQSCNRPTGYSDNALDCNDADHSVNPDATEVCNDKDDDCDGLINTYAVDAQRWYADADRDGFGEIPANQPLPSCSGPEDSVNVSGDCDDQDASINPDAEELCDNVDQDCDNSPYNGLIFDYYWPDSDGDGFGDAHTDGNSWCEQLSGTTTDNTDCDDVLPQVNPAADEVCDGFDDDCDGAIDEGAIDLGTWYRDGDGDGVGGDETTQSCDPPEGFVALGGDCDDTDPEVIACDTDDTGPSDTDTDVPPDTDTGGGDTADTDIVDTDLAFARWISGGGGGCDCGGGGGPSSGIALGLLAVALLAVRRR